MATETQRRKLKFASLDDAVREAESLRDGGYRKLGKWDLSQACGHLADWMTFPVDGYPPVPFYVRPLLHLMRITVAKRGLRKALAAGEAPAGAPTLPATVPAPGGDEAAAVERLRKAVERFKAHAGPYKSSILFGELNREDSERLQAIHCALHLGNLIPGRGE